jgi:hypothetical protein
MKQKKEIYYLNPIAMRRLSGSTLRNSAAALVWGGPSNERIAVVNNVLVVFSLALA